MPNGLVEAEDRDGIRILRLSRPPVNALDLELARATQKAVADAGADASCGGLVLTGLPGVFSAGIDTRAVPAYGAEQRAEMLLTINRMVLALYALEKPAVGGRVAMRWGILRADARLRRPRGGARGPSGSCSPSGGGIPFPAGPLAVCARSSPRASENARLARSPADPTRICFAGILDRVGAGGPGRDRRRGGEAARSLRPSDASAAASGAHRRAAPGSWSGTRAAAEGWV